MMTPWRMFLVIESEEKNWKKCFIPLQVIIKSEPRKVFGGITKM